MSRKACALLAGWLAVVPAGLAQTPEQPAGGAAKPKARPLSPYYATATTGTPALRGGEQSEQPPTPPPSPYIARPPVHSADTAPANGYGATCTTGCDSGAVGGCGSGACGPYGRAWVSIEYLLWTTKAMNVPQLVTGSGNPNLIDPVTGLPAAGTLSDPLTTVLNDDKYNDDWRSGLRVRAGFWLDECQTCGLEGSYFFLANGDDGQLFNSFNGAGVFRPFFNADPAVNAPDAQLIVFPNRVNGTLAVATATKFQGFDANFRKNLTCGCNGRIDFLAGYRYLRLQDRLQLTENLQVIGPNPDLVDQLPVGTTIVVQDTFETTNTFNGGQLGLAGEFNSGRYYFGLRGLVAVGNTNKEISVNGYTRVTEPGATAQTFSGGLLAQRTNLGSRSYDDFSVVPEATATIGYQVTNGIRVFATYNFLYWSNVSRAGEQIDLTVDGRLINQAPDAFLATRPAPVKTDSDFWAQGVSLGLEVRY